MTVTYIPGGDSRPTAVPAWWPDAIYQGIVNAAATIFRVLVPILLADRWNRCAANRAANLAEVARITREWAGRVTEAARQHDAWRRLNARYAPETRWTVRDGIRVVTAVAA